MPPGKPAPIVCAHQGAGAVAARDIAGFASLSGSVAAAQPRGDEVALVFETLEFGIALDGDAESQKALDEQAFVLVLWEDMQKGVRRKSQPDGLERHVGGVLALDP